jgi:DNA-binding NtrC family response regulator
MHATVPIVGLVSEAAGPEGRYVDEIIEKPITGERLRAAVQNCLRDRPNSSEDADAAAACGARSTLWPNEIQPLIRDVAAADIPVLIQGETGVGKEVVARQLHVQSARARKAFLKVNCAALPSELIESELFGYERGAFTGAFKTTPGKFEMADGGSILLDEIGDMDFKLQAKLLQVLQDREFVRLGSSEPRRADVRVLAATHCNLERAIVEKRFREDLYYRLNIITINVPALRDRKDEIMPLAHHFMHKYATSANPAMDITASLREALLMHEWPGNVRELENVIRRLLVLRRPELVAEDIRTRVRRLSAVYPAAPVQAPMNAAPAAKEPVVTLPRPAPELMAAAAACGSHVSTYRASGSICEDVNTSKEYRGVTATPSRPFRVDDGGRWSILDRVDEARREAETEAILQALNSTLWNRKRAAELLSIDYKALLYKMKKLGIIDRAAKIAI